MNEERTIFQSQHIVTLDGTSIGRYCPTESHEITQESVLYKKLDDKVAGGVVT
jgi:hypothetical protein